MLSSVFTQVIVCAAADESNIRTTVICPSTALAVVIVMVRVAAELFVTVFKRNVTGTVAALPEAAIALLTSTMLLNLFCAVQVCAVLSIPTVAPSTEITPAETRAMVVSDAAPSSIVPQVNAFPVPIVVAPARVAPAANVAVWSAFNVNAVVAVLPEVVV